ncbi:hypothetical protein OPKNFCMD_6461 [Methylobacterium crusticola]|uniref:YjiS-like domain-containing protein n=1 Tax=Methylobacterium crusticola TaxID=1697972 RepID=A0ABQ4R8Y6_9HYPH|nr:DUF1127 domain-containing protein [Methylobacterium crusticola]GJD53684.1 hypothetical protein OPKNFCMD_6461 [Methylobacterium crusticola]
MLISLLLDRLARYMRSRRASHELRRLDDRELADIGLLRTSREAGRAGLVRIR